MLRLMRDNWDDLEGSMKSEKGNRVTLNLLQGKVMDFSPVSFPSAYDEQVNS